MKLKKNKKVILGKFSDTVSNERKKTFGFPSQPSVVQ
jgi:hypothetical protein